MRVSAIENYVGNDNTSNSLGYRVAELETSFPDGCNTIMQAVTAKGQTPASNSPSDIASAISNISSGIDIFDLNTWTEEIFLNYIDKNVFDNKADQCIGKAINLQNSQQDGDKTMPWVIIGYNHDSTTYTFDLWASRAMFDSVSYSPGSNNYKENDTIRTKIENIDVGFNSDIQNRLQYMNIICNGTVLTAKSKLLSMTEMNFDGSYYFNEGNKYNKYFPIRYSSSYKYNELTRYTSDGTAKSYWTRSRRTDSSYIWAIRYDGYIGVGYDYTSTFAVLPVIRLSII